MAIIGYDHSIQERNPRMPVDLITPENVSIDLLKNVFTAYMDTYFDEDGDLIVKGECQVYVTIIPDKSSIRLMTIFLISDESSLDARLAAVNKINNDYIMVKAHCSDNNKLIFTYYFMLAGGLTKKALIRGVKLFDSIPRVAIGDYAEDIIK
jgi:hypothetical protein